ncbi:MAG: MazG nucleotide pyrophosphohydrolase domain-containing protein [Acidimicrobiales bacterium]
MSEPTVRVVGLGPGDRDLVTEGAWRLISESPEVRLRTRRHPAAASLDSIASYDDWYDTAESFDELYRAIADDLVRLANEVGEVLYVVPGSPVVAERTVELLYERPVRVVCEPAVSVIDLACGALGRDPMAVGLRVVDALGSTEPLVGPGPLLVLQTYSAPVLASVADRLGPETPVTVLHHLGLADQVIEVRAARELAGFAADHLTSLWVDELRSAGTATDDLVSLTRTLRRACPWDQEQTHASLTRHLLEEAYEALDALESLVRAEPEPTPDVIAHVQEELGDLLFQIVFHAELGDELDRFNLATIADAVRSKLIGRHPHVFADVEVRDADDVAVRWEVIKQAEKGRTSVLDGIAWQLPALTLYTKLLRKATSVGVARDELGPGVDAAARALAALDAAPAVSDASSTSDVDPAWGDAIEALARAAYGAGVDLEGVLRDRVHRVAERVRATEASPESHEDTN